MNLFQADINVMTKKEILDPQGKAVKIGLANLGFQEVEEVRIGKHIVLQIQAQNLEDVKIKVEKACKELLANLIMEQYTYTIKAL